MEIIYEKREDKQLLMLTHLSQLINSFTAVGGFVVPLIIWMVQKDKIMDMNQHGKAIINFQLSLFVYTLICIPLILLLGLGILGLIVIGVLALIFPILNAIKASNGALPSYPFSIRFIS